MVVFSEAMLLWLVVQTTLLVFCCVALFNRMARAWKARGALDLIGCFNDGDSVYCWGLVGCLCVPFAAALLASPVVSKAKDLSDIADFLAMCFQPHLLHALSFCCPKPVSCFSENGLWFFTHFHLLGNGISKGMCHSVEKQDLWMFSVLDLFCVTV